MRNRIYLIYLLFIALFLMQSCGVMNPYKRPNLGVDPTFRDSVNNKDTSSMVTYQWRSLFPDQVLVGYIEEALKNNTDYQIALRNIDIANAYFRQSGAAFAPSFGIEANAMHSVPSRKTYGAAGIADGTNYNDLKLGGIFSWELDIWGKIASQKRAGAAQFRKSEQMQRLVMSQIVTAISQNYYALLSLDKKKEILLKAIENRKDGVMVITALKNAGNVTEVAVKQNESLLYSAQAMLIDIDDEIYRTENALCVLMGKRPDHLSRGDFYSQNAGLKVKTGVPIQLLENRPDVVAAEQELISAFELTKAATASFYPTLSISASGGLNGMNFNNLFNSNALFSNLIGNLSQPLLGKRLLRTQKEVQVARQEIAFQGFRNSILTAYQEVSNSLKSYQSGEAKLVIQKLDLEAQTKALEFSEELQKQGLANYLEVIKAKESALNADLAIIQTELQILTSIVDLYRALGGGWK